MKKTISPFVLAAFFCFFAMFLFSCGEPGSPGEKSETAEKESGAAEPKPEEGDREPAERLQPDLPEAKFDGYEMNFLTRNEKHMIFVSKDIFAAEENGDAVNDAVYRRNSVIEDRYGIKIAAEAVENPYTFIQKLISSGDCPYDAMIEATIGSVTLSAKNMLVNLKVVPHLNFEKPWWDQTLTKELAIAGKLFCNVSDLIIADKDGTWGLLFNKNIMKDYGLEDPYKLAESGKWTIDRFFEMSKGVSVDLNGDGKYDVTEDKFGFATEPYNIFVMIVGAGCRIAEKDGSDWPVMSANNERFLAAYEKAVGIDKDISTINAARVTGAASGDPFYGGIIPAFDDGRIMFYMGSMALVPLFRGMEQDFGILPIPKYDDAQEKYCTTMSVYNNGAIFIPATNDNLERTGILLEALSAESKYTLRPAYYDITLKTKLSRDDESSAMLDILFSNRIIDVGATYNFGGVLDLVTGGKDNFISGYEKLEQKANAAIQKLIEQFD
ncbi:MAG: hypothetical protein FWG34_08120 [Oscillospiraceae bacterium]|nr:hypothetical protein [Oscillospiraceae bacterium]